MSSHSEFMQRAITLSIDKMEAGEGGPFGAVIVKDNKIIAEGWNQVTSKCDPTAHAEMMVIRKACQILKVFHLEGCILYTSCEPCPMCLAAIYWAHLDAVYYANTREDAAAIGFDDAYIYEQLGISKTKRDIKMESLLKEKAIEAFRLWNIKEEKKRY